MIPFLLAAALALPPDAVVVRVGEDGWPTRANAEVPAGDERVWWWSPRCAPQRVSAEAPAIECRATRSRRVRVTHRETGKPLRGARVVWGTEAMRSDIPDAMLPVAVTDDLGDADLALPDDPTIRVRVIGPRVATWWLPFEPILTAVDARETTIHVLPASRATIEIELPALSATGNAPRSWAVAADGKVTLPALPPNPYVLVASADASAPLVTTIAERQFPSRLELDRGIYVAGRVVDAKRRPIESATIEAVFKLAGLPRGVRRRLRSGPAGRFALNGLPAGVVQLTVRQAGRATVLRRVDSRDDVDLGDITLHASRDVLVRVVDRDGSPIAGASLRTSDGVHATSNREGVARLANVAEGFAVEVAARGFRTREIGMTREASVIELSRGVRVTGTIAGADTGNVLVMSNGGRRVVPFDDGTIDLSGLDAGTLALEIRAKGYAPLELAERPVIDDELWDLGTLQLSRGATIIGRVVVRGDDVPVAGAVIRALRSGADTTLSFVLRDWIESAANEEGVFAISGLTSESHVLVVEAAGHAPRILTAKPSDDAITIELDRARSVVVDCVPAHRCGDEARLLYGGTAYPWASSVTLMRGGRARFAVAGPGAAVLRLVRDGHVIHERSVQVGTQDETAIAIHLAATRVRGVVVAGGRAQRGGVVELQRDVAAGGGMPVYLESRTAEGQVAGGGWLDAPPRVRTAAVDGAGRFAFDDIEPGAFQITYRSDGGETTSRRIVVPETAEVHLTVEVP